MFVHELSHYSVCTALGNKGVIHFSIIDRMTVSCEGIENNTALEKFILFSIPYIMIFISSVIIFFNKNNLKIRMIGYAMLIDALTNYFGSLFMWTDFTQIATHLGTIYLYISLPFVLITAIIEIKIFFDFDYKPVKMFFKKR